MPFSVLVPDVEEVTAGDPLEVARENARRKAEAVPAEAAEGATVLAVDTVVALGDEVFGKPRDAEHAAAMLGALSGREHRVISGLALRDGAQTQLAEATTHVRFRDLQAMVQWYVATGEWRDRAGGYAIQARGAALATQIVGDYLNVVGLPVGLLIDLRPEVLGLAR